ncbi:DUF935 family protein [Arthrobacter sulfonylureivorans]|uniref:phage portal protein family protein n=1 Tax=Arthrobacter sulfonylureivorans TaxID=2486855 RepID=UPI0039E5C05C
MASKPNTKELGQPGGVRRVVRGYGRPDEYVAEPLELNRELAFPASIPIYDTMRSQDGHIGSLMQAITLPIVGARWDLDADGVDKEVVALVRTELGLPEPGKALSRRRRQGIVLTEHIEQVTETMLWAGFAPFEQVYEVAPPRKGQEELGLDEIVHLRKLAPRLPRTIERIIVGRDGGLEAIWQTSLDFNDPIEISVNDLVFYVNKKEGADWSGRSLLRQAYKHWMIKDIFLRLDAQAAERNSMGIPTFTYSDEAHQELCERLASEVRAGEKAGLALPHGVTFKLEGVSGSTVDLTPKIEYHDREIARTALAMFLDLGHDNGARSLGETFLDVFLSSVQSMAQRIADTVTEHVIRDLVEFNFGPDAEYPALTPGDIRANQGASPEILTQLANAGLITPDGKLEDHLRERYGLPKAAPAKKAEAPVPAPADPAAPAAPGEPAPAAEEPAAPAQLPAPAADKTAAAASTEELTISQMLERVIELRQRERVPAHAG